MPLRQIEVIIPSEGKDALDELLEDDSAEFLWKSTSEDDTAYHLKVLMDVSRTEQFLDKSEELLSRYEEFRLVVSAVEATLPRIEEDTQEKTVEEEDLKLWEKPLLNLRVSREELYSDIVDSMKVNRIYFAMVVLSTIVAAFGLQTDDTAVVIGAMVIAPLLGPNVGLALATALGDLKLGIMSLKSNLSGLLVSLAISILLGMLLPLDSDVYNISSRTNVHLSDIALALAAGSAGVLAYTVGMSSAVVGVMVAVALLPPLVAAGLLLGNMQLELALYALLLLATNIICVNLAAVTTLKLQGVRPRLWYETQKAKTANRYAMTLWVSLLLILAGIIWYL